MNDIEAANSLIDHLQTNGIDAGVGITCHAHDTHLNVLCRFKKDLKKVPVAWRGFQVEAKYIGKIKP